MKVAKFLTYYSYDICYRYIILHYIISSICLLIVSIRGDILWKCKSFALPTCLQAKLGIEIVPILTNLRYYDKIDRTNTVIYMLWSRSNYNSHLQFPAVLFTACLLCFIFQSVALRVTLQGLTWQWHNSAFRGIVFRGALFIGLITYVEGLT